MQHCIRELITLGTLNDIVEDEDIAVVRGFEHEDILKLALFVMQDFLHPQSHGLAGPHLRDLAEPAIWVCIVNGVPMKFDCATYQRWWGE